MCRLTSKAVIVILTFIFWALAGGLIFVGSYIWSTYGNFYQLKEAKFTVIPAIILLSIGVLVFIIGILGCAGAVKENRCLLATFCTILLLIVVATILAGVLGYVYRGKVESGLKHSIKDGMQKYGGNNTEWTHQIDYMQKHLHCCGANNATDWDNTPWGREHNMTYPASCGNNTHVGCYMEMKDFFLSNLAIIAGTAASFVVVMVLGIIASCVLVCKRKDEIPYVGLTNPGSGLRV